MTTIFIFIFNINMQMNKDQIKKTYIRTNVKMKRKNEKVMVGCN